MIRETTQAQAPKVAAEIAHRPAHRRRPVQERGRARRAHRASARPGRRKPSSASPCRRRFTSSRARCARIESWLKAEDVSKRTIALEIRVEEDLLGTRPGDSPPAADDAPAAGLSPSPPNRESASASSTAWSPSSRWCGCSSHGSTTTRSSSTRPAPPPPVLPPAIRQEVETLEATQDEIRDSLAKIGERLPVAGQ